MTTDNVTKSLLIGTGHWKLNALIHKTRMSLKGTVESYMSKAVCENLKSGVLKWSLPRSQMTFNFLNSIF